MADFFDTPEARAKARLARAKISLEHNDLAVMLSLPEARRYLARDLQAHGMGQYMPYDAGIVSNYNLGILKFKEIAQVSKKDAQDILIRIYDLDKSSQPAFNNENQGDFA